MMQLKAWTLLYAQLLLEKLRHEVQASLGGLVAKQFITTRNAPCHPQLYYVVHYDKVYLTPPDNRVHITMLVVASVSCVTDKMTTCTYRPHCHHAHTCTHLRVQLQNRRITLTCALQQNPPLNEFK